ARTSLVCSAVRKALLSVSTVPLGVRAGTKIPNHSANSSAGYPASATVGTSGSSGLRCAPVVASARSVPARTCGTKAPLGEVRKEGADGRDAGGDLTTQQTLYGGCRSLKRNVEILEVRSPG